MVLSWLLWRRARLTCDLGSHSWMQPVETLHSVYGLHLCEASVHRQFRSRDVAAVVGCDLMHAPRVDPYRSFRHWCRRRTRRRDHSSVCGVTPRVLATTVFSSERKPAAFPPPKAASKCVVASSHP